MGEPLPLKNDPKVLRAWCFYDWANSVYSLVINTAIFPIYFAEATKAAFGGDKIPLFGSQIEATVAYSYALSLSYGIIVVLSLILSGLADFSGRKRLFLQIFSTMGALACMAMFFFTGKNVLFALMMVVIASVGYAGSLVFYNAFLPVIASPDKMDSVSARGFTYGYVGSLLLLIVNLLMVMMPTTFGFKDAGQASRVSFLMVGVWWIAFTIIPLNALKKYEKPARIQFFMLKNGFLELQKSWNYVQLNPLIKNFLACFFFLSMGVQTIILLASLFGKQEIGMESTELIIVIILVQILAVIGAELFAKISHHYTTYGSLFVALIGWFALCGLSYFVKDKNLFYGLAGLLGLLMGGIQSQSRSLYAKLLPADHPDYASFFSFYDLLEKAGIVIGTFSYATIQAVTGSLRNAMFSLAFFFLISMLFLQFAWKQSKVTKQT